MTSDGRLVYIGTYTQGDSKGIYVCRLDMSSGELRPTCLAGQVDNPSFLVVDGERNRLYAVNELMAFNGRAGGAV
ncbi:MAG: beta-propeller fold lactonase family protein, partial [Chloroflexota bacterium]